MSVAKRMVTYADVFNHRQYAGRVSVRVRLELELADGCHVLLLEDRGWGSTQSWSEVSAEDLRKTARVVVGPDEPPSDRSRQDMERSYWDFLQQVAGRQGIVVTSEDLMRLRHDVVLSKQLLARIGADF